MKIERALDGLAVAIAIGIVALVLFDEPLWFRPAWAAAFVLFVPGWTLLRLAGVPLSSLTLLGAFGLSVVAMTLTSFALVTRFDWTWRPTAVGWAVACTLGLVLTWRRRRPSAPSEVAESS